VQLDYFCHKSNYSGLETQINGQNHCGTTAREGLSAVDRPRENRITVVLFDYGGVLAEEGFREGLKAIGRANGLDPEDFFQIASEAVYDSGYAVGAGDESAYWKMVSQRTGIKDREDEARAEILDRFVFRHWMLEVVRRVQEKGCRTGILSDQTDWLDRLNDRDGFFKEFDCVFNSYHIGLSKKHGAIFRYVAETLEVPAANILFIDDNRGNIERAALEGFRAIHYIGKDSFLREMEYFGLWP